MSFRYVIETENPIVTDGNKMFNCNDGKLRLRIVDDSHWNTGTPTEEGWYLLQYLNSGEYDVGRWDGSDFVIEENLPMVLTSHRSVVWQRIEPYREKN